MTKKIEEIDESKKMMVCMDPLVLSGSKFCFCCVPTCMHCRLMTIEEYRLYQELRTEEAKFKIKLQLDKMNEQKEGEE